MKSNGAKQFQFHMVETTFLDMKDSSFLQRNKASMSQSGMP